MNVPILKFFKYPINKAIGSSAAIGLLISVFGSIGFLSSGVYLDIKLPLSIGFINIPAFLIFIPITTVMARLGAKLLYKVERNIITKLFAIFLLFVATKLMFDYFQL